MEERKKILKVVEKYKGFFDEWDADVALGVRGVNFFYVFDQEMPDTFEVFNSFRTSEELEKLILGCIGGNITLCIDSVVEDREMNFHENVVNGAYNTYFPEEGMRCMFEDLQWLAGQGAKWFGLMEKTYRALAAVGEKE